MQASVRRVPDSPLLMWGMVGFLVLLGGVFAVLFFMSSSSAPARTLDIYVDESGPGSLVWLHAVA